MWLLNVTTKTLEYFEGDNVPPYSILSHRWEAEEVLYQDVVEGTAHLKKGYPKLEQTCKQADLDGWRYIWIDTCCIDKKSSAELSEAINSMYRWYSQAKVCYAFLSDIQYDAVHKQYSGLSLGASVWFTRGWTLQELLAPRDLKFYDKSWTFIGCKSDEPIAQEICQSTSIPTDALIGSRFQPSEWCIALKMSWASRRRTSRVEDQAYCLLGLFEVNMPLLYGEGPNAFLRLQEEICKMSTDRSLFAWNNGSDGLAALARCGRDYNYDTSKIVNASSFFAPHIVCFEGIAEDVWRHASNVKTVGQGLCEVRNHGMLLDVLLWPLLEPFYAAMMTKSIGWGKCLYIYLKKVGSGLSFHRVALDNVSSFSTEFAPFWRERSPSSETILILRQPWVEYSTKSAPAVSMLYGFDICIDKSVVGQPDHVVNNSGRGAPPRQCPERTLKRCETGPFAGDIEETLYTPSHSSASSSGLLQHRNVPNQPVFLSQHILVPWPHASWWIGCVYYTSASTNELVVLTLGWNPDYEPFTVMHVFPQALSGHARERYQFAGSGLNKCQISPEYKSYISTCFGHMYGKSMTDKSWHADTVTEGNGVDQIKLFVFRGSSAYLGDRYPSYEVSQRMINGYWRIYLRKQKPLHAEDHRTMYFVCEDFAFMNIPHTHQPEHESDAYFKELGMTMDRAEERPLPA